MKKIIIWTILCSSIVLTSCGVKQDPKDPEVILKQTQSNLIENSQKSALSKKEAEFDWNLKFNVETQQWKAKWDLTYSWKWDNTNASINMWLKADLEGAWQTFSVDWWFDLIVTLEKIYVNLTKADFDSSDLQLKMLAPFIKGFVWQWYFVNNDQKSIDLSKNITNFKIDDKFKQTLFLKINKVISDREYEVSLNKENVKLFVVEVTEWISWQKMTDEDKTNLDETLKNIDIKWTLKIEEGNKYFTFDWTFENIAQDLKQDVSFKYQSNKLYINLAKSIVLDLDLDGDKFKWTMSVNWDKINLDGELNEDKFLLNVKVEHTAMKADLTLTYNVKSLSKFEVELPKNAQDLGAIMSGFVGWLQAPDVQMIPWIWTWN